MTPDEAIKIVEERVVDQQMTFYRLAGAADIIVAEVKRLREDQKIAQVALHMAMDAILSEHPLSPETISAVTAQITYAYRHTAGESPSSKGNA